MIFAIGASVMWIVICMWVYNYAYDKGYKDCYEGSLDHQVQDFVKQHKKRDASIPCVPEEGWEDPYYLALGERCNCPPGHHDPE